VVVVSGEAGIGKTALVRRFVGDVAGTVRVLRGACDDLTVPQAFGPLWDVAGQVGGELASAIASDDRGAAGRALREELARGEPALCVIEDTHWADEATLDVLAHVGRRIGATRSVLLVTFRDDELTLDHRLRVVVGSIPVEDVVRVPLEPLSRAAVATLAAGAADVDATIVAESCKLPVRVFTDALAGLVEDDAFADLGRITAPTLVAWGDRDAYCPRADQDAIVAGIPGARLSVYAGVGHSPHWEQPARFARELAQFVAEAG
jgi:predicted ATPase